MRLRPAAVAALGALLALAGCKVSVEGAPCISDANCPTDQRCGHSGRCSVAATGCIGYADPICQKSECSGADIVLCNVTDAVHDCASREVTTCDQTQMCVTIDEAGVCQCDETKCAADEVCDDAKLACKKAYAVAISGLSPTPPIGPAGATVTATVTLGSGLVPPPASLALKVDGNATAVALAPGTPGTYAGSWIPDANVQGTQQLTAVATATIVGDVSSASFGVDVDTRPPVVAAPALGCAAPPCLRDDELTVSASVDDPNLGAGASVEVALDLDGYGRKVPLVHGGGSSWSATVKLPEWSFPRFSGAVTARVWATDALGNATPSAAEAAVSVTRHRWSYVPTPAAAVTSPAVLPDGTAVVGLAAAANQLRVVNASGTESWGSSLGPGAVTSAPSVEIDPPVGGKQAVWVAADDGKLYSRAADGTGLTTTCPASGTISATSLFTPAVAAVFSVFTFDTVYSAGLTGPPIPSAIARRGRNDGTCDFPGSSTTDAATTSMTIAMVGASPQPKVFVATKALLGGASLRRMQDDGGLNFAQEVALALNDGAALPVACDVVSVPLAMDAKDATARVLAACANGQLHRVRPDFTASTTGTLVTTLAFEPSESIVILPGGDLLVPGKDSKLHRLAAATGAEAWVAPDLKSPLGGAAVVAPDAAGVVAYATTSTGHLWALDSSGAAVWSTDAVATPLGAGPLGFPTIAPARPGRLPTLLVGDGSGALHAVVVDTGLDTTSPWPKSHRDLRNTGNSAAPLP